MKFYPDLSVTYFLCHSSPLVLGGLGQLGDIFKPQAPACRVPLAYPVAIHLDLFLCGISSTPHFSLHIRTEATRDYLFYLVLWKLAPNETKQLYLQIPEASCPQGLPDLLTLGTTRWVQARIRTQSTIAKAIWHHQNPARLQQELDKLIHLKGKKWPLILWT